MECPKCNSVNIKKAGNNVRGRQRYQCKICKVTFRPKSSEVVSNDNKKQAMQMYLEGLSPQRISVLANKKVSDETIRKWVGKFKEGIQPNENLAKSNINDFRKTQREELPPFEDTDIMLSELHGLLNLNKSKTQSGILIIGLDISNPFSFILMPKRIESKKKVDKKEEKMKPKNDKQVEEKKAEIFDNKGYEIADFRKEDFF